MEFEHRVRDLSNDSPDIHVEPGKSNRWKRQDVVDGKLGSEVGIFILPYSLCGTDQIHCHHRILRVKIVLVKDPSGDNLVLGETQLKMRLVVTHRIEDLPVRGGHRHERVREYPSAFQR